MDPAELEWAVIPHQMGIGRDGFYGVQGHGLYSLALCELSAGHDWIGGRTSVNSNWMSCWP
jgi:hypothetical protein